MAVSSIKEAQILNIPLALQGILRQVFPSWFCSRSVKYEWFEDRGDLFLDERKSIWDRDEYNCMDPLQDMESKIDLELMERRFLGQCSNKYVLRTINDPDFGEFEFSMRDGRNGAFLGAEPEASTEEYDRMSIRMYGKIIRRD